MRWCTVDNITSSAASKTISTTQVPFSTRVEDALEMVDCQSVNTTATTTKQPEHTYRKNFSISISGIISISISSSRAYIQEKHQHLWYNQHQYIDIMIYLASTCTSQLISCLCYTCTSQLSLPPIQFAPESSRTQWNQAHLCLPENTNRYKNTQIHKKCKYK